jgi:hypothetical protein
MEGEVGVISSLEISRPSHILGGIMGSTLVIADVMG